MKIYEIIDEEEKISVGVLMYYEKKKDFIIELQENLDEWTAPLLFSNLVKNKIYTVPRKLSFLWVRERVIPIGRQNISYILKNHHMESYDEMKFLEYSKGKCSQDSLMIRKIDRLPGYVIKRRKQNILDCVACEGNRLMCFFVENVVKIIDVKQLTNVDGIEKILKNSKLYQSCQVGTGGYFVTFNDSIDLPAGLLYEAGVTIPLSRNDFISFAKNNLMDTSECCEVLACSRQNVSYMVKQGKLNPIKEDIKGNLYIRGDVLESMW